MLTRTLLKEPRLDAAIITPVPDQTSTKVTMLNFLFRYILYVPRVPPPPSLLRVILHASLFGPISDADYLASPFQGCMAP